MNVGLIGYGRIAEIFHLKILKQLPDVQVTALAEANSERLQQAGQQLPRADLFADYHELLGQGNVDAVVICLPTVMHADAAAAAFGAGKHVYLEKPIATTLDDARRVVEAWQSANTVGMMGFNFRFHPLYRRAKALIEQGEIGELRHVRTVFSASGRQVPDWKRTRASGGGVLLDLASHHIDLTHFLFGHTVEAVSAFSQSCLSEDDNVSLQLQLSSGLLVQSTLSMNSASEHRCEIYGQDGKLTIDLARPLDVKVIDTAQKFARLKWLQEGLEALHPRFLRQPLGHEPSFKLALAAFAEAVRDQRPVYPDMLDGYQSLAVIDAAERAIQTRQMTEPHYWSTIPVQV